MSNIEDDAGSDAPVALHGDYMRKPLSYKVKKVARYVRLYGVDRTRVKVLGQLHMRRRFDVLPASSAEIGQDQSVAIVGCGNYAFCNIAYFLRQAYGRVIGACVDVDPHRAASMSRSYGAPLHSTSADEAFADPRIKLVYIASNHASHAEYAIAALREGKHVYIEKPHVVSDEQLERLLAAMRDSPGKVFLGFNRPTSPLGAAALEHLRAERGSGMYSWFVAGHDLPPGHWYFDPEEGGKVLGNLCHWTDLVLHMAPKPAFPLQITPARGTRGENDMVVTFTFPDDTLAVIAFGAKGETFEGVRETLCAQRGDCMLYLEDFRRLTVERGPVRKRTVLRHRDHGHRRNILRAYESAILGGPYDRRAEYDHIAATAWLFLRTKDAVDSNERLVVPAHNWSYEADPVPSTSESANSPATGAAP